MSALDFNDAEPQRGGFGELIPDGSVALVVASLRPGGHGPGSWLKNSSTGECLMADFEFTIEGGELDRRKFWGLFVTEGQTEGQQKAANITRSRLRAMLESAYGVDPSDDSAEAQKKRQVTGWQGFDGLRFCARIGIEKGGLKDKTAGPDSERYNDKNVLKGAVTPDDDDYISPGAQVVAAGVKTVAKPAAAAANSGAAPAKPKWAS